MTQTVHNSSFRAWILLILSLIVGVIIAWSFRVETFAYAFGHVFNYGRYSWHMAMRNVTLLHSEEDFDGEVWIYLGGSSLFHGYDPDVISENIPTFNGKTVRHVPVASVFQQPVNSMDLIASLPDLPEANVRLIFTWSGRRLLYSARTTWLNALNMNRHPWLPLVSGDLKNRVLKMREGDLKCPVEPYTELAFICSAAGNRGLSWIKSILTRRDQSKLHGLVQEIMYVRPGTELLWPKRMSPSPGSFKAQRKWIDSMLVTDKQHEHFDSNLAVLMMIQDIVEKRGWELIILELPMHDFMFNDSHAIKTYTTIRNRLSEVVTGPNVRIINRWNKADMKESHWADYSHAVHGAGRRSFSKQIAADLMRAFKP